MLCKAANCGLIPGVFRPISGAERTGPDVRILLVDDDAELSAMLGEYLAAEGFETDSVLNGESGVEAALSGRYAAVVLDVMLPRLSGVEALRRIREKSRVPIIMLTAKGDNIDRVIGLELGADDYMPKPCYPRELVARLRAVLRRSGEAGDGGVAGGAQWLTAGPLQLSPGLRQVSCNGTAVDLTVSEFNLLETLIRAGDRVVSKDELSTRALGRPREAYDRSVDVHVSNLRQKLEAAAGAALEILTARGVGYRLKVGG
jgi:two-component system OmpR family response regulator